MNIPVFRKEGDKNFHSKCTFKFGRRLNFFMCHSVTGPVDTVDQASVPEVRELGSVGGRQLARGNHSEARESKRYLFCI